MDRKIVTCPNEGSELSFTVEWTTGPTLIFKKLRFRKLIKIVLLSV